MAFWVYLLASFFLISFGQPAWVPGFGMLASFIGFALFWRTMLFLPRARSRFFLALLFFFAVHAVQLSWMTSSKYMGPLIYVVYIFLLFGVGVQFALLSLLIKPDESLSFRRCLGIAGCWVCLEWSRLYFLSGFTWNPVGLALADSSLSLQWASLFGIYGLSFWVIFVNLAALKAFFLERNRKNILFWAGFALLPYGYGVVHQFLLLPNHETKSLTVALVQTGLLPEQKDYWRSKPEAHIPPLDQWERVLNFLKQEKKVDLIVLPETAFPYGAYRNFYPLSLVEYLWISHFGTKSTEDFPPLKPPFADPFPGKEETVYKVNNLFLAQALANHYKANLIIGLDAHDLDSERKFNAAFHFHPQGKLPERYEKRVLVPLGEYIPLQNWGPLIDFIQDQFGIGDSFDMGTEAKVFQGPLPIGIAICLEEIYTDLLRDLRRAGAELFVSISNDVWFPDSRLSRQHFDHGRIRAVENGVCILRSCNTGVTGGIDSFGRPLACLPVADDASGALIFSLPVHHYKTLYTWWGDRAILGISVVSLIFLFLKPKKKLL